MDNECISDIIKQYGTPLYIYDTGIIKKQLFSLKETLPPEFRIFYSMKANPLLWLCQFFSHSGCGIETASIGELCTAVAAGVSAGDLIFTSPGKTRGELEYAVDLGIYSINAESIAEVLYIDEIAGRKSKLSKISLRINPDFDYSDAGYKMTGIPSQFGIDQKEVESAVKEIGRLKHVRLTGIHVYTGTQILNADNLAGTMEAILDLAANISGLCSVPLEFLDLGGGFGIPYFRDEEELSLPGLKMNLAAVWGKYKTRFSKSRVVVESGRFLMADAGIYATAILYKKKSRGKKYLVCDGGSNHNAVSAFLGRRIRNNFPMYVLGKEGNEETVTITGPLAAAADIIGQDILLPGAQPGDVIIIGKTGAYGLTFSPVALGSHMLPAEVVYHEKKLYVMRERGRKEDLLKNQCIVF